MATTRTIDELINAKDEVLAKLNNEVKAYNDGLLEDKPVSEMTNIRENIDELSKEHASACKKIAYAYAQSAPEGSMIYACREFFYPCKKVAEEHPDPDSKDFHLEIKDAPRKFDLGDLHKASDDGIGSDKMWIHALSKLNLLLTADVAKGLGASDGDLKEINNSFRMAQIAHDYDLGKNPASNKNILETLRKIVTMMIGEELGHKAILIDVRYLKEVFARPGKKPLEIKTATDRQMRVYLMSICHRIITQASKYSVAYDKKKDDETKPADTTQAKPAKTTQAKPAKAAKADKAKPAKPAETTQE